MKFNKKLYKEQSSSQNTLFFSSGILDDLDNHLYEPKSRNSHIISCKNLQGTSETNQFIENMNNFEIEDDDALINFIDIENTRRNNTLISDQRIPFLETENIMQSYNFFPKENPKSFDFENTIYKYKIQDPNKAIIVISFFFFQKIDIFFLFHRTIGGKHY